MSKTRVTKETQLNVMSLIYSNERVFFISARSSEHCCALYEPLTDCGTHQPIQGQQSSHSFTHWHAVRNQRDHVAIILIVVMLEKNNRGGVVGSLIEF